MAILAKNQPTRGVRAIFEKNGSKIKYRFFLANMDRIGQY